MGHKINIGEFFAENVYNPDFTDEVTEDGEQIVQTVRDAADALLYNHALTGIDLTCWDAVLQIVLLAYPDIIIEGPHQESPAHTVLSPEGYGETGRYWLDGDTSKPCNENAYGLKPWSNTPLPRTR